MTCSCKWDGAVWKWDCALNEIITEICMEMRFQSSRIQYWKRDGSYQIFSSSFLSKSIVHQQEEGKFQKTKLRDSKGRKKKIETHVRRPKFGQFDSSKKVLFELLSLWLFMLTIVWNVCPPSFEVRLSCIFLFVRGYPNFVFVTHWFPSAAHELTFATSPQFHFTLHCHSWSSFEVRITMMMIVLSWGAKKKREKKLHFYPQERANALSTRARAAV